MSCGSRGANLLLSEHHAAQPEKQNNSLSFNTSTSSAQFSHIVPAAGEPGASSQTIAPEAATAAPRLRRLLVFNGVKGVKNQARRREGLLKVIPLAEHQQHTTCPP